MSNTQTPRDDDFYVGYLPIPPSHKRWLLVVVPGLLIAGIGLTVLVASQQRDPGPGVWEVGRYQSWRGVLVESPYPMLVTDRGTYLLVSTVKRSAAKHIEGFDRHEAVVQAALLERDGRRMLEVSDAPDAVQSKGPGATIDRRVKDEGEQTLSGEIIDPKCYLGAMKPSSGRTHKACAILCIKGGIPPMFVTRNPDQSESYYLLTDSNGDALPIESFEKMIAEPVVITGRVLVVGDQQQLRVSPSNISYR